MSFQIKPNRKETENKTIRFPISLIDKIEIDEENNIDIYYKFKLI